MKKLITIWVMLGIICSLVLKSGVVWAETETEVEVVVPDLFIKAVNPGYTIDGKSNVGEMIEIGRKSSDAPISLAGLTVRYTNSSGNDYTLIVFPDNSYLIGESVLLRLASSPDSELANETYSKTLAMNASLALMQGDEVMDTVCWTGKSECYKSFVSSKPTTLVRNLDSGGFNHVTNYEVHYDKDNYRVNDVEDNDYEVEARSSQCRKLIISEVLSYYETSKDEQFIEFYNSGSEQVLLDGCKVRYKNKEYNLNGIVKAEEYYVYYPVFGLTKNPTNYNTLEIVDADGQVVHRMEFPNGQRKGTSYAMIGYDANGKEIWRVTYAPTPGLANNYQEYRTCEEGKVINEATGNCVKVASIVERVCKDGYYLNILTGRCKKIEVATEKTCKEGYYLNPETGRCRKIIENKSADYGIAPEQFEEKTSFVALYAVIGVMMIGAVYLGYEFRHQIVKAWKRVVRR